MVELRGAIVRYIHTSGSNTYYSHGMVGVSRAHRWVCTGHWHRLIKGPNIKYPPGIGNKMGTLTVITYACNNLTNLEYDVHPFTGKGNVESCFKNANENTM